MFTPAEYELLRKRSSAELAQFLSAIALPPPTSWEDTAQVKQLDADAARRSYTVNPCSMDAIHCLKMQGFHSTSAKRHKRFWSASRSIGRRFARE